MAIVAAKVLANAGHVSPTGVPASYVVVWEWENRPTWWRPYSPEVTQLLERAHNKKLNRIYLKDADPLLQDYYINMTSFEQVFEPTGATYAVRREFYPHNCPAGKGSKVCNVVLKAFWHYVVNGIINITCQYFYALILSGNGASVT